MKFEIHSERYQNNYTKEENQKFTVAFAEIANAFAAKMAEAIPASDESVQALVKRHFDFCSQFWSPKMRPIQVGAGKTL
jgi:hypothetical protein